MNEYWFRQFKIRKNHKVLSNYVLKKIKYLAIIFFQIELLPTNFD